MVNKASNLMGFHSIDNNKVHRSTFDLSRRNLFTSKIGELLPVFCEEVMPGDDIKVNMQHFSRSMPIQTAAFTRLRENVQFFFVPYTSLYYRFRECMQNMTVGQNGQNVSRSASSPLDDKSLTTELPYMAYSVIVKYLCTLLAQSADPSNENRLCNEQILRISDTAKLLMSLGYGNFTEFAKIELVDGKLTLNGSELTTAIVNTMSSRILSNIKDTKLVLSPFRLLAYHRVANDHYRFMQWQPWRSFSCNVDYLNGETSNIFGSIPSDTTAETAWYVKLMNVQKNIFDMEYSNLPLDYFNGAIPNQQFGDESVVNLSGSGSVSTTKVDVLSSSPQLDNLQFTRDGMPSSSSLGNLYLSRTDSTINKEKFELVGKIQDADGFTMTGITGTPSADSKVSVVKDITSSGAGSASLSIIELRKATALQRYKEIQNCHDADFVSQVKAHFGVTPNDNGEKSIFLGGYSSVFDINPQINQNLTGDNVANIQAAPTASGNGSFHFKAKDYGVIIGIYRITPQLDYAQVGLDRRLLMTDAADFPIPELDSIGMQETLPAEIFMSDPQELPSAPSVDRLVKNGIGYAPRYAEWKIAHDSFQGAYLSSLKTWVTGQNLVLLQNLFGDIEDVSNSITPSLLVCSPALTKDIFVNQNCYGGIDNDQFMIGSYISVIAERNLSRYGLPY